MGSPVLRRPKTAQKWADQAISWITGSAAVEVAAAEHEYMIMAMAESFHDHIKPLYRSCQAHIARGHGGREIEDWDVYSKAWHQNHGPARYRCGGVREENSVIILENYLGNEVARLPFPPHGASFAGLHDGELFALGGKRWTWSKRRKQYVEVIGGE
jgi:hypothetical protein